MKKSSRNLSRMKSILVEEVPTPALKPVLPQVVASNKIHALMSKMKEAWLGLKLNVVFTQRTQSFHHA
jgi:hypothetical protein